MCAPALRFVLSSLCLAVSVAACGADETVVEEESDAPVELGEFEDGKADSATGVQIALQGGLTLEDTTTVALPTPDRFVGFVVLAPAGADLSIRAAASIDTRVTLYGPRTVRGWGASIGTGIGSVRKSVAKAGQYLVVPQPRYRGQSGQATVTVACFGTNCLGQCAATAAAPKTRAWVHDVASPVVTAAGEPMHRAFDAVVKSGSAPVLTAKFSYGAIDKDLEDEDVELWVRTCPGWKKIATVRTDDDGFASATLPRLSEGEYRYFWYVPGDGTRADGLVSAWSTGRNVVVSDIDGTLTTDDGQIFSHLLTGDDPAQYPDAEKVLWTVRRLGYRIEYVSGRPQILTRHTKAWLAAHRFPPGAVKVTDATLEVLPTESGVGTFKTDFLGALKGQGLTLFAGYGNATTDISAYQANAIPNARLFIIGPHAGESGTTAIPSYTAHLPAAARLPFADRP